MLDPTDISGVVALLARLVRVQDERTEAKRLMDEAAVRHTAADTQWKVIRGAFVAFGFDINEEKLWDKVKAEIGQEKWDQAFNLARAPRLEHEETDQTTSEQTEESDQKNEADETAETPLEGHTAGTPQNVREIVINQLKAAGDKGQKAADIRHYFNSVLGRELHEKTVGMTLYRLSRDGLVRREGRTWFAVPETANPGAATPGLFKSAT